MAKKVLIADNDPVLLVLMTEQLVSQGFEVDIVRDGAACLQEMKSNSPDILILDLVMPDMSGVEILESLRKDSDTSEIPVVMLSANTATEAVHDSHKASPEVFLQKPFELQEVLRTVQEITQR